MDKNQVWQLYDNLKEGEKIEIYFGGDVKISRLMNGSKDGYHKQKKIYIGKLTQFPDLPRNFRMKTKSWATPKQKGKKNWIQFGAMLPKRIRKTAENKKVIQWAKAFQMLKSIGTEIKNGIWVDTFMQLEYETKTVGDITVYYYQGNARYIQFKEEKLIIPQFRDTLNTEYFTNEQLGLEDK